MGSLCKNTPTNRTEWLHFHPGTLTIVNANNVVEHCFWTKRKLTDLDHFIVLNFTSLKMNCESETVAFEDEQMCNVTLPHCVIYGEKECKRPSNYDDCAYHDSDDYENFLFHAKTSIKGHGLSLNYSFYKCLDYNQDSVPKTTFNNVQLPLIIALSVLVFVIILCICVGYRYLRKQDESSAYRQYVTTVTSQATMLPDELPRSSSSFEFSRSYEAVPRGAAPLFDIYELSPKHDSIVNGLQNTDNNSSETANSSSNIPQQNNRHHVKEYVSTKDLSQVTYSKDILANVAPIGYNNVGYEIE